MGWIKRVTGQQAAIDQYKANAKAVNQATEQSATDAQNALIQQARSAAQAQEQAQARDLATTQAQEALSTPVDTAEVSLTNEVGQSAAVVRKRRATFGTGYNASVSL